MATTEREFRVNEFLLIWPKPLSSKKIEALFTMVFMNVFGLVNYVSKVLTKTDTFHLIIPLDCLQDLLNDPVYEFPQVICIRVLCDSISDLKRAKRRYISGYEKVQFCTINDLLNLRDGVPASPDSTDESIKDAVISLIEARILAKKSDASIRRSQIQKLFASTSLYGFPVRNSIDFAPCFVCPSCELVNQRPCRLECGHQQCQVCVNIRPNCEECSKVVSGDEGFLNPSSQIKIEDQLAHCSSCEWTQRFRDYEVHLKQNHYELITCCVQNQEVDESIFHHQHLTETSEASSLDNQASLHSDKIVTSLNGTCIWEISNVGDLKYDIASGRRKSIYSAPFYLFPKGYKVHLRLFFNGVNKTKGAYVSLFLVIMRGDYDIFLRWPFKFKVTFTLLDQLQSNNHQSKTFWSDATSTCFERPRADMNKSYGFSEFLPSDVLEKYFIQNDTMFVKIEVDCLTKISEIPPNDDAGELIDEEVDDDANDDNISGMICQPDNSMDAPQSN